MTSTSEPRVSPTQHRHANRNRSWFVTGSLTTNICRHLVPYAECRPRTIFGHCVFSRRSFTFMKPSAFHQRGHACSGQPHVNVMTSTSSRPPLLYRYLSANDEAGCGWRIPGSIMSRPSDTYHRATSVQRTMTSKQPAEGEVLCFFVNGAGESRSYMTEAWVERQ